MTACFVYRMMYAMDSWLEQLDDEVAPYVEPLLQISYIALDSPDARPQVKEMLLSACASAAAAAGQAMHPHLPSLLPRLERCLVATDDKHLRPRARALEVLGMLVSARGGKDAMAPHISAAMAAADSGFELDYGELREYGHGMYAEVAEALCESFAPYLPACLDKALASLRLDDGVLYDSDEEEHERAARGGEGSDVDEEDDDLNDSDGDGAGGNNNYSIFSGVVEEKAAACKAIASYAHHCPDAFKGHIGQFLDPMGGMADYMHEMVRSQAHHALARMAQCALKAAPPPSTEAFPVVDACLNATQRAAAEDDDRDAVGAAMESAAEVVKSVAAAAGGGIKHIADAGHLKGLSDHCLAILEGRAPCQEGDDTEQWHDDGVNGQGGPGDEEEEEDEEAELGQIVLEGVAELLPALAAVGGAEFAPHFQPHFAALMKRTHTNRPEGQRSVSYATIVEVIRAIGPAASAVIPLALPGCCAEFTAESAGLRRNAAYCAGVMVEVGGSIVSGARRDVAAALLPLLSAEETDRGVRDNAAGAAVRVLSAENFASARDPSIAPATLAATLAALPIAEDFEEAASAYGGLAGMFVDPGCAQTLAQWAPATARLFVYVVADERDKASRGWPGRDGSSKYVKAETIGRIVAAFDAMCAADVQCAAVAEEMTIGQMSAFAEARAGNIPQP